MNVESLKQILSKNKLSHVDLENLVVYVLVKVYGKVNWRRIVGRSGRDPLDVFQHRVLAASYTDTFSRFLERLCLSLGIQSVRVEGEVLEALNRNSERVLDLIRHNSIYLVAKAYDTYKKLREVKKKEGETQ